MWDGDWALLEEYSPNNVLLESYLQSVHGLLKTLQSGHYYYQDSMGSTSHIANNAGSVLESYTYNMYGKPTFWSPADPNNPLPSSAHEVRDLHTGQRWVPEIGLYDDRNRFMSPELGRFLQPDPIGFKGDTSNLYRYCGNNWANKSDPLGLQGDDVSQATNPAAGGQVIQYPGDNAPSKDPTQAEIERVVVTPDANDTEPPSSLELNQKANQVADCANGMAMGRLRADQDADRKEQQFTWVDFFRRPADFFEANITVPLFAVGVPPPLGALVGVNANLAVTGNGNAGYLGFGPTIGLPAGGWSLTSNQILQKAPPSPSTLNSMLTRGNYSVGGGLNIGGTWLQSGYWRQRRRRLCHKRYRLGLHI